MGDLRPDQVTTIARRVGVTADDVVQMNRRLAGDASLNAPIHEDGDSADWQDWLVDNAPSQERVLIETEELDNRRSALRKALVVLDDRERRIFEARHLADDPITLESLAEEFGVSHERVRQIEVRAFGKVRNFVRHRVAAMEGSEVRDRVTNLGLSRAARGRRGRLDRQHTSACPRRMSRRSLQQHEGLSMDPHLTISRNPGNCGASAAYRGVALIGPARARVAR